MKNPSIQIDMTLHELNTYFEAAEQDALQDYITFLKFESISTNPQYKPQVLACAYWLVAYLKEMGLEVELWPTQGNPVIFATHLKAGPKAPTLLIYHHYDVQPVDPLELWESPPFQPTIRNGNIYARGAEDNKGQCFYTIQAIKALLRKTGNLPVNLKLCIEGEEEVGSHGLNAILNQKEEQLKADYLVIGDVGIPDAQTPAVTLGARGIVTMDVELEGSLNDLHSGSHGGVVYNPLHALVELLAKLHDPITGKVNVPGFYDQVLPLSPSEHAQFHFAFDEKQFFDEIGFVPTGGEKNFSPWERAWIRPTIEINGIGGGYSGPGFKTVIPAKATAKLSCRLVPGQNPQKISQLVADFLHQHVPLGICLKTHLHQGGGAAVRANPSSQIVQAFSKAYQEVFQAPTQFILCGGSIPIVTELAKTSQSEVVLVGLGLTSDLVHAPNEHFGIDRFKKGFLIMGRALCLIAHAPID